VLTNLDLQEMVKQHFALLFVTNFDD